MNIRDFSFEMEQELVNHEAQNDIKYYDLTVDQLKKLLEQQFLKRVPILMASNDETEIKKQVTHLANYCYFVRSAIK
jgi:hypothetical protein